MERRSGIEEFTCFRVDLLVDQQKAGRIGDICCWQLLLRFCGLSYDGGDVKVVGEDVFADLVSDSLW